LETLSTMPREGFVPEHVRSLAYMEGRVPLHCGQEMLSPLQEAHILQALALTGQERVLEVGTGVGFLTACVAMHAKEVVSFEIHPPLADKAKANLAAHGVANAKAIVANAMDPKALEGYGTFDAIVLGAALPAIPDHIPEHLNDRGKIVAFLGRNPVVTLTLLERVHRGWRRTGLMETLLKDMEGLPERRKLEF